MTPTSKPPSSAAPVVVHIIQDHDAGDGAICWEHTASGAVAMAAGRSLTFYHCWKDLYAHRPALRLPLPYAVKDDAHAQPHH